MSVAENLVGGFAQYLNRSNEVLYPDIIYCEGTVDGIAVEVAVQHNDSYSESAYSLSTTSTP